MKTLTIQPEGQYTIQNNDQESRPRKQACNRIKIDYKIFPLYDSWLNRWKFSFRKFSLMFNFTFLVLFFESSIFNRLSFA